MRVLVTGASGFLGLNIRDLHPPWDLVPLTRADLDLADGPAVHAWAARQEPFDAVVHCAARVNIPNSLRAPDVDARDNVYGTLNLARFVRTRHLVYLSSGAVYEGQVGLADPTRALLPTLPYATHKLVGEMYARAAVERWHVADRTTIVRFFGAYGPHEPTHKFYARVVRTFLAGAKAFGVYGEGENIVDAMWAPDAARAIVALVNDRFCREPIWTLDLCRGEPMTIDEVVRLGGLVLGAGEPEISHYGVASERNLFWGNPTTVQRELDWAPTHGLREGFLAYQAWLSRRAPSPGMCDSR